MKLYRTDVVIYGTLYIKAESKKAALKLARGQVQDTLIVEGDVVSDKQYDDPDLPEVSLSPAMTFGRLTGAMEMVEEL